MSKGKTRRRLLFAAAIAQIPIAHATCSPTYKNNWTGDYTTKGYESFDSSENDTGMDGLKLKKWDASCNQLSYQLFQSAGGSLNLNQITYQMDGTEIDFKEAKLLYNHAFTAGDTAPIVACLKNDNTWLRCIDFIVVNGKPSNEAAHWDANAADALKDACAQFCAASSDVYWAETVTPRCKEALSVDRCSNYDPTPTCTYSFSSDSEIPASMDFGQEYTLDLPVATASDAGCSEIDSY